MDPLLRALEAGVANPNTRAAYITRLQQLTHELGAPTVGALMLRDAPKYIAALRARASSGPRSPLTTKNMVAAVLACYKYADPAFAAGAPGRKGHAAWTAYHQELKQAETEAYKRNEPLSDRQERNYVSISDVDAKLQELAALPEPHASLKDSQALLLLAMYAWLPPKRSDYGELWVHHEGAAAGVPSDEVLGRQNYVRLPAAGGGTLVINLHKTANTHHAIVEDLPPPLDRLVRASLRRWPRRHLFVDRSRRPYTNNGFTKYVIRTFASMFEGRAAGTSLLRHAYISERVDFNRMSVAEREAIAKRMGHSTAVQELVYKWVNHRPPAGAEGGPSSPERVQAVPRSPGSPGSPQKAAKSVPSSRRAAAPRLTRGTQAPHTRVSKT